MPKILATLILIALSFICNQSKAEMTTSPFVYKTVSTFSLYCNDYPKKGPNYSGFFNRICSTSIKGICNEHRIRALKLNTYNSDIECSIFENGYTLFYGSSTSVLASFKQYVSKKRINCKKDEFQNVFSKTDFSATKLCYNACEYDITLVLKTAPQSDNPRWNPYSIALKSTGTSCELEEFDDSKITTDTKVSSDDINNCKATKKNEDGSISYRCDTANWTEEKPPHNCMKQSNGKYLCWEGKPEEQPKVGETCKLGDGTDGVRDKHLNCIRHQNCPPGQLWNYGTKQCDTPPSEYVEKGADGKCPAGSKYNVTYDECLKTNSTDPNPTGCDPNTQTCPDTQGNCPAGTTKQSDGTCKKDANACDPNVQTCPDTQGKCPAGTVKDGAKCVLDPTTCDSNLKDCSSLCSSTQTWSDEQKKCVDNRQGQCPEGHIYNKATNQCLKDDSKKGDGSCPEGHVYNKSTNQCILDTKSGEFNGGDEEIDPANKVDGFNPFSGILNFNIEKQFFNAQGQCPVDKSFSILGGTLNLSYQPTCDLFAKLSWVFVACAWLFAIYIVLSD